MSAAARFARGHECVVPVEVVFPETHTLFRLHYKSSGLENLPDIQRSLALSQNSWCEPPGSKQNVIREALHALACFLFGGCRGRLVCVLQKSNTRRYCAKPAICDLMT